MQRDFKLSNFERGREFFFTISGEKPTLKFIKKEFSKFYDDWTPESSLFELITTYNYLFYSSPSGKLMQIEYALQAVSSGAASVGLKASNGVVLATEKKTKSILYEEHSTHKIEMITDSIGAVYSGMGPDYRQLVRRARKMAHQYKLVYGEPITTSEMVKRLATVMQEFTQSGGVRPFGVSLLIAGWDSG